MGTPLCDRCKKYILKTARPVCPYCKSELPPTPSPDGSSSSPSYGTCPLCATDPNLPPTYVVGDRSGLLDLLLHEYKYNSVRALARPLAELLDTCLPIFDQPVCLVPLPTATHHIRARGFDHTLYLAKRLARLRDYTISPLLARAKNTTQVGATRDDRLKQAISAYKATDRPVTDPNTLYLLFDDISTTGASITAATAKLRSTGVSHLSVALLAVSIL